MTCETPKPRETACSATWRSGYAADCKSKATASDNNTVDDDPYQDIPGTGGEHDNRHNQLFAKENAAPDGPRCGAKIVYENELQAIDYTDDSVMRKVEVSDRRRYSFTMADGLPMAFTCGPDGLVSAYELLCDDGRVLRVERRVTTVVPPLFYGEGKA